MFPLSSQRRAGCKGNQTGTRVVNRAMLQIYTSGFQKSGAFPAHIPSVWQVLDGPAAYPLELGPNDGGVHRGDREDTGDNEARPTEKGSGDAHKTIDDTAFGGESSISHPSSNRFDLEEEREDFDGIEIMQADDGRLGLTNFGDVPADDWAADTGDTAVPDGEE